jgi:hypothetical protein
LNVWYFFCRFYEKLRNVKPRVIISGGTAGEAAGGIAAERESKDQLTVVGGLLSVDDVFSPSLPLSLVLFRFPYLLFRFFGLNL